MPPRTEIILGTAAPHYVRSTSYYKLVYMNNIAQFEGSSYK